MTFSAARPLRTAVFPITANARWLQRKSPAAQGLVVILGTLLLAASSHVSVPMVPVPMTLQTLAVTLIGAVYGWRLGALTIVAWLAQGALGLPVLAGGGGFARFIGPTGGYLFAFPLAAALTGWMIEHGHRGPRMLRAFAAMLAGNALCLLLGGTWLAVSVGVPQAIVLGIAPFVLGGLLKSVLGAALLEALQGGSQRASRS